MVKMKKIAVDAMGGDFAPQSVVEGVEKARNKYPDLRFMLFGDEQKIREILTSDMLWSKRPGTGIPSHRMPELIGKTAVRNIEENTLLSWEDVR